MSTELEELAREGMLHFTAAMQVSPDLAARTVERHRQRQRRNVLRAGLAVSAAGAVTAAVVTAAGAHGQPKVTQDRDVGAGSPRACRLRLCQRRHLVREDT